MADDLKGVTKLNNGDVKVAASEWGKFESARRNEINRENSNPYNHNALTRKLTDRVDEIKNNERLLAIDEERLKTKKAQGKLSEDEKKQLEEIIKLRKQDQETIKEINKELVEINGKQTLAEKFAEGLEDAKNNLAGIITKRKELEKIHEKDEDDIKKINALIANMDKKIEAAEKEGKDIEKFSKTKEKLTENLNKKIEAKLQRDISFDAIKANEETAKKTLKAETLKNQKLEGMSKIASKVGVDINKLSGTSNLALAAVRGIFDVTKAINNKLNGSIDKAMGILSQYAGSINARLYGSDYGPRAFQEMLSSSNEIWSGLAANVYVSNEKYIQSMDKIVSQGVAFDVEQRALLAAMQDKIVTTFDALDANLERLVRVRQADITYSSLGVEAYVNELLNTMFKDTSYLSDIHDSIYSGLTDAMATMTADELASFQFSMDKWLGAMYSTGASSATLQQIAQGLGYLLTGDVQAMTSNVGLNNLFSKAAQMAGLSYSDLFTGGLTGQSTNELLENMVLYLQDISANTDNKVVKKAMADAFGFNVSDLASIVNISNEQISTLSQISMDYSSAISKANQQVTLAGSTDRTTIDQMISNFIDNSMLNLGMNVASDTGAYASFKIARFMGGILDSVGTAIGGSLVGELASGLANFVGLASIFPNIIDSLSDVAGAIDTGSVYDASVNFKDYQKLKKITGDVMELSSFASTSGEEKTSVSSTGEYRYSDPFERVAGAGADSDLPTLPTSDSTTPGSTTTSVTGAAPTTDKISDLYTALFTDRKAILVDINSLSDKVIESISGIEYEVKDDNNFGVNSIITQLQTMKGF